MVIVPQVSSAASQSVCYRIGVLSLVVSIALGMGLTAGEPW